MDDDTENRFPRVVPHCGDCDESCDCGEDDDPGINPPFALDLIEQMLRLVGLAQSLARADPALEVSPAACHEDWCRIQVSLTREAARLARLFDEDEKPGDEPTGN
jgi:hypothetical protein